MKANDYKKAAQRAVQLNPFLSIQDEIVVPSGALTIFKMKMTRPIVSEQSIIESGMHGTSIFTYGAMG